MTRRDDLEALAARVEALTGPCRETDCWIRHAIYAPAETWVEKSKFNGEWCIYRKNHRGNDASWESNLGRGMAYTASLDAAMKLASDDRIAQFGGPLAMLRWAMEMLEKADATADTLPRYVTAAALRALAAQEPTA